MATSLTSTKCRIVQGDIDDTVQLHCSSVDSLATASAVAAHLRGTAATLTASVADGPACLVDVGFGGTGGWLNTYADFDSISEQSKVYDLELQITFASGEVLTWQGFQVEVARQYG